MRGDCAPDRSGGGTRRAVRPDCDPGALSGTLPAAGGGGLAPGRNSGPLHARLAAAGCRRAQLSGPAALRRRAPLRHPLRRVPLARTTAGGRGTAHARGMGAPAGGRRRDRRTRPLGDAPGWPARRVPPPLSCRGRRGGTRAAGAAHRVPGEAARLRAAGYRETGRASRARHVGRVDCRTHRPGRAIPCANRSVLRSCWKSSSPCRTSVRRAWRKCCW